MLRADSGCGFLKNLAGQLQSSSSEKRGERVVSPSRPVISTKSLQSHPPAHMAWAAQNRAAAQIDGPSRWERDQECATPIQCSQLGLQD